MIFTRTFIRYVADNPSISFEKKIKYLKQIEEINKNKVLEKVISSDICDVVEGRKKLSLTKIARKHGVDKVVVRRLYVKMYGESRIKEHFPALPDTIDQELRKDSRECRVQRKQFFN